MVNRKGKMTNSNIQNPAQKTKDRSINTNLLKPRGWGNSDV